MAKRSRDPVPVLYACVLVTRPPYCQRRIYSSTYIKYGVINEPSQRQVKPNTRDEVAKLKGWDVTCPVFPRVPELHAMSSGPPTIRQGVVEGMKAP